MDDRTKEIVELVRSGLSTEEIAKVFECKKTLEAMEAVERLALQQGSTAQPATRPLEQATPVQVTQSTAIATTYAPPRLVQARVESMNDVISELITRDDFETAPLGSCWELPVPRLQYALKGAKTGGAPRRIATVIGGVGGYFRDMYGTTRVSCRQEDEGRLCLVTKTK